MSDPFWLTDAQLARLEPFFPKSHHKPRIDDLHVWSGIIFVNRNGLRRRDAPAAYGPHMAPYNRWKRWNDKSIFARMRAGLAAEHGEKKTVIIDATYLKAHIDQFKRQKGGGRGRLTGRTKGGMNAKLRAICDSLGRPLNLFVTGGPALVETVFRLPCNGSATTLVHGRCRSALRRSIGCSGTSVMMPTALEKR